MRLTPTAPAVTSLATLLSLTLLGASPASATRPVVTPPPTATATPTPAPSPTATATPTSEPTPEPSPTATATPSPTSTPSPTATPTTEPAEPEATGLVDLTILGKLLPLSLPGLTLPFNLGQLDLNPSPAPAVENPRFGGGASGAHIKLHVGDAIQVRTNKIGAVEMDPSGRMVGHTAAYLNVPRIELPILLPLNIVGLTAQGVNTTTSSYLRYPSNRPSAWARTEIANLSSDVYFANITAEGIHVNAAVEQQTDGQYRITGGVQFAYLSIAGAVNQTSRPVEPNTTYELPGLGKVVLNEQKITEIPGDRYAAEVHAIHITLSTATLGLPAGADIYVGSAEAIIYDK